MAERTVSFMLHCIMYMWQPIHRSQSNVKWTELKKGGGLEDKVAAFLRELKSVELKNKGSLLTFWSNQTAVAPRSATLPNISSVCPSASSAVSDEVEVASDNHSIITPTIVTSVLVRAKVQEALKNDLSLINSDLVGLLKRKSFGLLTDSQDDLKAKN